MIITRSSLLYLLIIGLLTLSCGKNRMEPEEEDPTRVITSYFDGYTRTQVNFKDAQGFPPLTENWELVELLSDEFDGESMDLEKWNDLHPVWSGRPPSAFKRENTTVNGGFLRLKSTSRVDDLSEVTDPETDIWVDAASMTSKTRSAQPGYYYEASMKASDLSMTSSFWFRMGDFSEIDVIEHIGHSSIPAKEEDKAHEYHANTWYYGIHEGLDNLAAEVQMDTRGRDEFHTYGVWWKDPKTLLFYHNGEQVMRITPRVDFDENLFMIFDTEVFTWDGLPTIASLKDDGRNTMLVDFVRTYKLAETFFDSGILNNGSFEQNGTQYWRWKGIVNLNAQTTNFNEGVINLNLRDGGSIIQKVALEKNTDYQLDWNAKVVNGNLEVEAIEFKSVTQTEAEWTPKNLTFNSGNSTEVYIRVTASASADTYLDAISLIAR